MCVYIVGIGLVFFKVIWFFEKKLVDLKFCFSGYVYI